MNLYPVLFVISFFAGLNMKDFEEQHVSMKILYEIGKNFYQDFSDAAASYGEDCLSHTQRYKWYQHFKSNRMSTEDELKTR